MHFLPNCVLLDVPAFDINTKCPRAWFKKGIHAIITRPTTRANTMSRLYVISAAESYVSSETVTEHYTILFATLNDDRVDAYHQTFRVFLCSEWLQYNL